MKPPATRHAKVRQALTTINRGVDELYGRARDAAGAGNTAGSAIFRAAEDTLRAARTLARLARQGGRE